MMFVGVDPGKSGGIATIKVGDLDRLPKEIEVHQMPTTSYDIFQLIAKIQCLDHPTLWHMEKVHAMPGNGATSMFNFGFNYGLLKMAVVGNGIGCIDIAPRDWMKGIGIKPKAKNESQPKYKDRLRGFAQSLYPNNAIWQETLGNQRGVCDALLIAHYGFITFHKGEKQ